MARLARPIGVPRPTRRTAPTRQPVRSPRTGTDWETPLPNDVGGRELLRRIIQREPLFK
jgi:hypothetical protein